MGFNKRTFTLKSSQIHTSSFLSFDSPSNILFFFSVSSYLFKCLVSGFYFAPRLLGEPLCQKSAGERQTLTASESIQGERWLRGHPESGHVAEVVSKVEAGNWCGKMGVGPQLRPTHRVYQTASLGDFPDAVKNRLMQRMWVQSLVWKLRSHMPWGS